METPPVRKTSEEKELSLRAIKSKATPYGSTEISTLRDELKETHKAYRNDILSYQKHIHSQSTHIKDLEEMVNKRTSEITALERTLGLAQWHRQHMENLKLELEKENEKWIGATLKFQYLFEQMDKIGLKQSEDIFDCFRDIKVPGVCVHIREKYVPTELTNAFSDDEDDDDLPLSDDDIIGGEDVNDEEDENAEEDVNDEEDENDEEDVNDEGGNGDVISNSLNVPPSLDLSLEDDISQSFLNDIIGIEEEDDDYIFQMWTFYTEKGIIDTITWPTDHLHLAAERYSLNIPDMPRTLQIHLVEQCMKEEADIGWFKLFRKVITIQRIFRGYRARKP